MKLNNQIIINEKLFKQIKVANSMAYRTNMAFQANMANQLKMAYQVKIPIIKFQGQLTQMQEMFREPLLGIIKFQEQFQVQMKGFYQKVTAISKFIDQNTLINLSKIKMHFEKLSEKQKELAQRMIRNGWYFSLELPLDSHDLLDLNNYDFNRVLTEFYEQYQEEMFNKIIIQFPHRKKILAKAYQAHKNKDYELSIPVMFAQADGISEELFSKKLFSKNNSKLATEQQTEILFNENNFIDKSFYIQLATIGQLNENYNPLTYKECKKFNRHTVLHGKDINYAKKINSIKCLVMLNFLGEIKENYYEEKIKTDLFRI